EVVAPERLLERSRLGVRAVEDDEVACSELRVLLEPCQDLGDDPVRLVLLVRCLDEGEPLTGAGVGPERLPLSPHVFRDHAVRRLEDRRARTVILLEADDGSGGKITLEVEDVRSEERRGGKGGIARWARRGATTR